jgi:hypothetical protein
MGLKAGNIRVLLAAHAAGAARRKTPGYFSLCTKAGRLERSHHLARLELEILEFFG